MQRRRDGKSGACLICIISASGETGMIHAPHGSAASQQTTQMPFSRVVRTVFARQNRLGAK
jgi:hypothetical protein